jgi:ferric-dicitrate binding protein FerR (iron transport regulator)
MSEPTDIRDRIAEERQLAGLIRRGGARAQPPSAVREAVRAAAHREWRAAVAARARRRNTGWSLAAAAAVAGLAVWVGLPALRAPGAAVAAVARVSGPVEASPGGLVARYAPLAAGAGVATGAALRSGRGGRAALELGGNSVRLDEQSAVTVLAANRIALKRGAVYVDSGAGAAPLVIETPYGAVEHLGTQYESRLVADGLRLRVREGRVRLSAASRAALEGTAGEQLTVAADGGVRREPVARAGGEWAWAGEIAPPFDIENRTLGEFLAWAARETGRDVAYATPELEAQAAGVVLRGSVQGLAPERALAAVLATTDFVADADAAGRWVIDLKAGDR